MYSLEHIAILNKPLEGAINITADPYAFNAHQVGRAVAQLQHGYLHDRLACQVVGDPEQVVTSVFFTYRDDEGALKRVVRIGQGGKVNDVPLRDGRPATGRDGGLVHNPNNLREIADRNQVKWELPYRLWTKFEAMAALALGKRELVLVTADVPQVRADMARGYVGEMKYLRGIREEK